MSSSVVQVRTTDTDAVPTGHAKRMAERWRAAEPRYDSAMIRFITRVILLLVISATSIRAADNVDWPNVGNDKGGMRYSPLDQVNRDSVGMLKIAWTYHTKDAAEGTTIECTPIVIDGVMYVTTVRTRVVALDAATGREIWAFDPYA